MHKAAERMGTSQPAVSRSIAELERALGVRLLDRNRRGVEPTHFGRAIIKRGIAIFDEVRQGIKDVEYLADPAAGELVIGCSEVLASGPVFAAIDRLAGSHPRMTFKVVTGTRATLYRELSERNVELVISGTPPVTSEHMVVERLFDDSLMVVAGSQSLWTRRRKIELAELIDQPWTLPPLEAPIGALALEAFRGSGLEPPRTAVITESASLRSRLVATGRFLTMLPRFAIMPVNHNPLLKALPIRLPNTGRTVAIVTLRNRTLSPLAELFIETAREIAKPLVRK
jgi:DNA-binding transcriptional LysR family regulator